MTNLGGVGDVNPADNFLTGTDAAVVLPVSSFTNLAGEIREVFQINWIQPGNNFRIAASPRQDELAAAKALKADTFSRLFSDTNGNMEWDNLSGEPPLMDSSSSSSSHGVGVSPALTVWRTLHVEVDSMGPPDGSVTFPDDGKLIDVAPGDVRAPDTSLLAPAFADAFINVIGTTSHNNGDAEFVYHLTDSGAATRSLDESTNYWAAYVMGAYEGDAAKDGDDQNEQFLFGINYGAEPEVAFISLEVIRDAHNDDDPFGWHGVYDETRHEQQVVAHEIGHQFELGHSPAGTSIMSLSSPSRPDIFSEAERRTIRETESP